MLFNLIYFCPNQNPPTPPTTTTTTSTSTPHLHLHHPPPSAVKPARPPSRPVVIASTSPGKRVSRCRLKPCLRDSYACQTDSGFVASPATTRNCGGELRVENTATDSTSASTDNNAVYWIAWWTQSTSDPLTLPTIPTPRTTVNVDCPCITFPRLNFCRDQIYI